MHQISDGQPLLVEWVLGGTHVTWSSLMLAGMVEQLEHYMQR